MTGTRMGFLCTLTFLITSAVPEAQILSGSATVVLTGPISKDQTEKARTLARTRLKSDLLTWMDENLGLNIDTSNALDNLNLESLIDTCVRRSKEESSFKGKEWTFIYTLTPDAARLAVEAHNARFDSLATQSWTLAKTALAQKNDPVAFREGIRALAAATAHLGPPVQSPGSVGIDLIDDSRRFVQNIFDRMQVRSSEMIIKGKAGHSPETYPSITVLVDSVPFGGMTYTAMLPSGRPLFSSMTDASGTVSLDRFAVPFVANGTFLYASPNLGDIIGAQQVLEAKAFGISLNKSQDQTFIFKMVRPTFALQYKATAVSKLEIPPDFSTDVHMRKFLKDSCHLEPASGGVPPDISITINSQVSSYNYDETEESSVKVASQIEIKGLSLTPVKTEQDQMVYEKRYEQSISIPLGLFFWETSSALRASVKRVLERL